MSAGDLVLTAMKLEGVKIMFGERRQALEKRGLKANLEKGGWSRQKEQEEPELGLHGENVRALCNQALSTAPAL